MAIFEPGSIVGAISGNVGGVNFAQAPAARVVRKARRRTANATNKQSVQQSLLGIQQARWNALAEIDKQNWRNFARQRPLSNRLGVSRYLSGYQYFLKFNLVEEIDDPPLNTAAVTGVTVFFSSNTVVGQLITFTGLTSPFLYTGRVFGQLLYRETSQKFNRDWKFLGEITTGGAGQVNFTTQWEDVFPAPLEDQYIACQFRPIKDDISLGGWTTQILQTT